MSRLPLLASLLAALLAPTLPLACGGGDACAGGACTAADGGAESGGDAAGDGPLEAPSECHEKADPKGEPRCVVNGFAIFVSATGNDANEGTKEKPLQTIGAALAKGKARVYVCEGTYAEHVKVTSGISLVGGFACSGWTYTGTKAKVAPADAGFALELANADGVSVSDLSFEAAAGTAASRSSVAAFARGAKGRLLRVELIAHEGKDGANAVTASNYDAALMGDDVKLAGHTAAGTVGGLQQDCPALCTNNDHSTGRAPIVSGRIERAARRARPRRGTQASCPPPRSRTESRAAESRSRPWRFVDFGSCTKRRRRRSWKGEHQSRAGAPDRGRGALRVRARRPGPRVALRDGTAADPLQADLARARGLTRSLPTQAPLHASRWRPETVGPRERQVAGECTV